MLQLFIHKILKIENNVDREELVYDAGKYKYDFKMFNTISSPLVKTYMKVKLLLKKLLKINQI